MSIKIKTPPRNLLFPDDTTLCHYTTLESLLGIIRPDNIYMWATHYQYLNDKEEISKGIATLKKYKIIDETIFENLFILSFSKAIDNLTMWRTYSKDYTGCILVFKNERLGGNSVECMYTSEEAEENYLKAYNFYTKGEGPEYFEMNGSTSIGEDEFETEPDPDLPLEIYWLNNIGISTIIGTKNSCFKHEEEVRIFFDLKNKNFGEIKYRSKNGLIIPFIECVFGKEVLSEIWLPNDNDERTKLTKQSLQKLLKQYGYNNVEVKTSESNYRSQQ